MFSEGFEAFDFEGQVGEIGLDVNGAAGREGAKLDQFRAARRLHEDEFRAARGFVAADFCQAKDVTVEIDGGFQIIHSVARVQEFSDFHGKRLIGFRKKSSDKHLRARYIKAMRRYGVLAWMIAALLLPHVALGQLDPERRELIEMGGEQPLKGATPIDAYAYYYLNEPNFFATNVTLRLAFAGVYLDSETGFAHLLGPNTDLGLGLAGGGFADSYFDYVQGKYFPEQSFFGHGVEASASIYHLLNPGQKIPLNFVFRLKEHYSFYSRDDTAPNFALPNDHSTVAVRTGLRWGGREPVLSPDLAMELSAWYEGQYRTDSGSYGFNGDRPLNETSQLFWGRALLVYTIPDSRQRIDLNFTAGGSVQADRLSGYRLGGDTPVTSEFPLVIPGYFYGELSARDFACFNAQYAIPLGASKRWSLNPIGSIATVDYLPGMAQSSHFNSGLGLGIGYHSESGAWEVLGSYGYGFEAIRTEGRGGQSVGLLLQYDFGARHPGRPSALDDFRGFFQGNLGTPAIPVH